MLKLNCVRNEYLRARLYINEILHVELKDGTYNIYPYKVIKIQFQIIYESLEIFSTANTKFSRS